MNALLFAPLLLTGAVDYEIQGDVIQVISKAPFAVVLKTPGDLFFWTYPKSFEATEAGGKLDVAKAPNGKHTIAVKIIAIDWENKKVNQSDATIELLIGQLPNPPPDPDDPDDPDVPDPPPAGCASLKGTAKQICGWVVETVPQAAQAKRTALSKMYTELAEGLESGRWINYSQSNVWFKAQRDSVLDSQAARDDWAKFGSRIATAIAPLASEPRAKVIEFYRDVAAGLGS